MNHAIMIMIMIMKNCNDCVAELTKIKPNLRILFCIWDVELVEVGICH